MEIVVVSSVKGGVGKTTTAINMAGILAEDNNVLLVDATQTQAVIRVQRLGESQGNEWPFPVVKDPTPKTIGKLPEVSSKGYEFVIIDTHPDLTDALLKKSLDVADYAVIPTKVSALDLYELRDTIVQLMRRLEIEHRALFSLVDRRKKGDLIKAKSLLAGHGIPYFRRYIPMLSAFERSPLAGVPITEYRGDARATDAERATRSFVRELLEYLQGEED